MIFTNLVRKGGFSCLIALFLLSCEKEEAAKDPSEYYISSQGAYVPFDLGYYELDIPAGALNEGQYINCKVTGSAYEPGLVIDSVFSFGPVSQLISFASYNCNSLLIPGTIRLQYAYDSDLAFTISNSKPYCIDNGEDMDDFANWSLIDSFTVVSGGSEEYIEFTFTDLTKTYFIGWTN